MISHEKDEAAANIKLGDQEVDFSRADMEMDKALLQLIQVLLIFVFLFFLLHTMIWQFSDSLCSH